MKKLGGLLLVGCLSLTLAGCKGDYDDIDKQVTEMKEKLEDLKDKDYKIYFEQVEGNDKYKETIIKDGNNFYFRSYVSLEGEETVEEYWYEYKGVDTYTVYSKEGTSVEKNTITVKKAELDEKAENFYQSIIEVTEEDIKACGNNEKTCEIEKNLFRNKVTFDSKKENTKETFHLVVKKGEIQEAKYEDSSGNVEDSEFCEFDYDDQEIKFPE